MSDRVKKGRPAKKSAAPSRSRDNRRYSDVSFWIVGDRINDRMPGTVIIRAGGDEMLLEVGAPDESPFLLIGRRLGEAFNAIEASPPSGEPPVRARWTRLGQRFVGTWLERGEDNLFTFTLPAD